MKGQSNAKEAVKILNDQLKKVTNQDYRYGIMFAIGVIEGVFMLNCKESLSQPTMDNEVVQIVEQLRKARESESCPVSELPMAG